MLLYLLAIMTASASAFAAGGSDPFASIDNKLAMPACSSFQNFPAVARALSLAKQYNGSRAKMQEQLNKLQEAKSEYDENADQVGPTLGTIRNKRTGIEQNQAASFQPACQLLALLPKTSSGLSALGDHGCHEQMYTAQMEVRKLVGAPIKVAGGKVIGLKTPCTIPEVPESAEPPLASGSAPYPVQISRCSPYRNAPMIGFVAKILDTMNRLDGMKKNLQRACAQGNRALSEQLSLQIVRTRSQMRLSETYIDIHKQEKRVTYPGMLAQTMAGIKKLEGSAACLQDLNNAGKAMNDLQKESETLGQSCEQGRQQGGSVGATAAPEDTGSERHGMGSGLNDE